MDPPKFIAGKDTIASAYTTHEKFLRGYNDYLNWQKNNGDKLFLYNIIKNILEWSYTNKKQSPDYTKLLKVVDNDKLEDTTLQIGRKRRTMTQKAKKLDELFRSGVQFKAPGNKKVKPDTYKQIWFEVTNGSFAQEFQTLNYSEQVEVLADLTTGLGRGYQGKRLLAKLADPWEPPIDLRHLFNPPRKKKNPKSKGGKKNPKFKRTRTLVAVPNKKHSPFTATRVKKKSPEDGAPKVKQIPITTNNNTGRRLKQIAYNLTPGIALLAKEGRIFRARKMTGYLLQMIIPNSIQKSIFKNSENPIPKMKLQGKEPTAEGIKSIIGFTQNIGGIQDKLDEAGVIKARGTPAFAAIDLLAGALGLLTFVTSREKKAIKKTMSLVQSMADIVNGIANIAGDFTSVTLKSISTGGKLLRGAMWAGPVSNVITSTLAVRGAIISYDKGQEWKTLGNITTAVGGITGLVCFLATSPVGVAIGIALIIVGMLIKGGMGESLSGLTKWVKNTYYGTGYLKGSYGFNSPFWGYRIETTPGEVVEHNYLRQVGTYFGAQWPLKVNTANVDIVDKNITKSLPLNDKETRYRATIQIPKLNGGVKSKLFIRRIVFGTAAGPPEKTIKHIDEMPLFEIDLPPKKAGFYSGQLKEDSAPTQTRSQKTVSKPQYVHSPQVDLATNKVRLGGVSSGQNVDSFKFQIVTPAYEKYKRKRLMSDPQYKLLGFENVENNIVKINGKKENISDSDEVGLMVRHMPGDMRKKVEKLRSKTGKLDDKSQREFNRILPTSHIKIK